MDNLVMPITVQINIELPIEKVWKCWTTPADIMQWNHPYDNWHSPSVENDLKQGGKFVYRMETKDGREGFDYAGVYDEVIINELIVSTGLDGRKSIIKFIPDGNKTMILEIFEPGKEPSVEIQKDFCQSVLNNFKKYAESSKDSNHN